MINFSTLQGMTIPEGVVTEIKDASGRVLWAIADGKPIVLEVEKQTITTYAGEVEYPDESVILLDIYPKRANSTVNVTYGGLTKTLTFSGTNAQQVFFGTFNGVSDEVETPASGTLTIEGGCGAVAVGTYISETSGKSATLYCGCVNSITSIGSVRNIPAYAFSSCSNMTRVKLSNIERIGFNAFAETGVTGVVLTNVKDIGEDAFKNESRSMSVIIYGLPKSLKNGVFDPYTMQGSHVDKNRYIKIYETPFDWDTWAEGASIYEYVNEGEGIGGSYEEHMEIYINDIRVGAITSVELKKCTSIVEFAFRGFGSLSNIAIPYGVRIIGDSAFYGCGKLTTIDIPGSVTSIGSRAFEGCVELTRVVISNGVTSIGQCAFYSCYSLASIIIPESVVSIGSSAFSFCSSLTSVTFKNPDGWYVAETEESEGIAVDLSDPTNNALLLTDTYKDYLWYRA